MDPDASMSCHTDWIESRCVATIRSSSCRPRPMASALLNSRVFSETLAPISFASGRMSRRGSARRGSLCMKTCADRRGSEWLPLQSERRSAASAKFSKMAAMVGPNEFNGSRHSVFCARTEMSFTRSSMTNFDSKSCKPAVVMYASVRRSKPAR
jgi:hypothetical protein